MTGSPQVAAEDYTTTRPVETQVGQGLLLSNQGPTEYRDSQQDGSQQAVAKNDKFESVYDILDSQQNKSNDPKPLMDPGESPKIKLRKRPVTVNSRRGFSPSKSPNSDIEMVHSPAQKTAGKNFYNLPAREY
mmetsp:Transcript_20142/g.30903  ORF Transcript_20142/g.30903 Transcript_20142/m.30903 type:complete len:132 (-) Transcript_20142:1543-1938(-)|eukprot:CAMPEP_0170512622 /NCGR_PEP_ID=MMETSP0208-20121228/66951_1 /TAXON_ID=197538 /ORGANISM="Strombidium inclinatum, Strain S3" /LENGTH=131 /DNA_ID=CAMNT_0010796271 /DNA_START=325 /DNA_END=720 /DNA_ORIENTATION=-